MIQGTANPFEIVTGANKLTKPGIFSMVLCIAAITAWLIGATGLIGVGALIMLPFISMYTYLLFRNPIIGLYTVIAFGFILLGLGRYVKGIQIGLAMDGILIITFIALIFNKFREKIDWTPAKKDITLLSIIWFCYTLFELVNPEARSVEAWFTGRGVSFYMLMIVPLALLFIDSDKKLTIFFYIWGIFSILASLKGMQQHFIGVDPWEQAWLDEGNAKTHILFGKLRSFSFLSDAGQFGGNQAYSALVATILAMVEKNRKNRIFYIVVAILGYYGMVLSGARGAMSVPLAGFMLYFVLRRNFKVMVYGLIVLLAVFVFFKYTSIGQGNDQIRRMRTAFDPNDASLQVRLDNQKLLKSYLASRPFGGGIGHGGVKAQRFLPNAFLSNVATDSWFVLIWVEQGIIGLALHLFILFYVLIKSCYIIMFRIRDPILQIKMAALASGMFGIMVASYGNAILGGMPTAMLIYTSMAVMMGAEKLDTPETALQPKEAKQIQ
jgi:hypothetical protein